MDKHSNRRNLSSLSRPDMGSINHVQERGQRARHCRRQTTPRLRDSSTYRNHAESAPNFSMRSWNSDLGKTVAEPEGKKRLGATIAIGPMSGGSQSARSRNRRGKVTAQRAMSGLPKIVSFLNACTFWKQHCRITCLRVLPQATLLNRAMQAPAHKPLGK